MAPDQEAGPENSPPLNPEAAETPKPAAPANAAEHPNHRRGSLGEAEAAPDPAKATQPGSLIRALYAAAVDAPQFRKGYSEFDTQMDEFARWWEALQKAFKQAIDAMQRSQEAMAKLAVRLAPCDVATGFLSSESRDALSAVSDSFRATSSMHSQLADIYSGGIVGSAGAQVKAHIKDMKDQKRHFEKVVERYDHAVGKYCAQSRTKEPSALVEEAYQLYELRKHYIRSGLDMALRLHGFENSVDNIVFRFVHAVNSTLAELTHADSEVHMGLHMIMRRLADQFLANERHGNGAQARFEALSRHVAECEVARLRLPDQPPGRVEAQRSDAGLPSLASAPDLAPTGAIGGLAAAALMAATPAVGHGTMPRLAVGHSAEVVGADGAATLGAPIRRTSRDATMTVGRPVAPASGAAGTLSRYPAMRGAAAPVKMPTEQPELEGYLYKRVGTRGNAGGSWSRRWFRIRDGMLQYCMLTTSYSHAAPDAGVAADGRSGVGTLGNATLGNSAASGTAATVAGGVNAGSGGTNSTAGAPSNSNTPAGTIATPAVSLAATPKTTHYSRTQLLASVPINILLCEARFDTTQDRRYCFELVSSQRTHLLQAESESEMLLWMRTIEAAKLWAVNGGGSMAKRTPAADEEGAESDNDAPLRRQPAFELDLSRWDEDDDGERLYLVVNADTHLIRLPSVISETPYLSDLAGSVGPKSNSPGNGGPTGEIDVAQAAAETISYPDAAWQRRNEELHSLLRSVPAGDVVLAAFAGALRRDILVQGRLWLTQNRLCFHSSIMGYVTVLVIQLAQVRRLQRRKHPLHSSIVLVTQSGQEHVFKIFFKDAGRSYGAIKTVWTNCTDPTIETSQTPQQLFDAIQALGGDAREPRDGTASSNGTLGTASAGGSSAGSTLNRDLGSLAGMGDENEDDDAVVPDPSAASLARRERPNVAAPTVENPYHPPPSVKRPAQPLPPDTAVGGAFDKEEANVIVQIPAKRAAELLLGESVDFWNAYHRERGDKDVQFGPFSPASGPLGGPPLPPTLGGADGAQTARAAKYIVPVNNSMVKVKEAECFESQLVLCQEEFLRYTLETRQSTPSLPYGDAFVPMCRIGVTWVSPDSCRVVAVSGIKWHKSPLVKSIIRSAASKALGESCAQIVARLNSAAAEYQKAHKASSAAPVTEQAGESATSELAGADKTGADAAASDAAAPATTDATRAPQPPKSLLMALWEAVGSPPPWASALLWLLALASVVSSIWIHRQNLELFEHGVGSLTLLLGVSSNSLGVARDSQAAASAAAETLRAKVGAAGHQPPGLAAFCRQYLGDGYMRWADVAHSLFGHAHALPEPVWDAWRTPDIVLQQSIPATAAFSDAQAVQWLVELFFESHFVQTGTHALYGVARQRRRLDDAAASGDSAPPPWAARWASLPRGPHSWNDTLAVAYPAALLEAIRALNASLAASPALENATEANWTAQVPAAALPPRLAVAYLGPSDQRAYMQAHARGLSRLAAIFAGPAAPSSLRSSNDESLHWRRFSQLAVAHDRIRSRRANALAAAARLDERERHVLRLLMANWVSGLSVKCGNAAAAVLQNSGERSSGAEPPAAPPYHEWVQRLGDMGAEARTMCQALGAAVPVLERSWGSV